MNGFDLSGVVNARLFNCNNAGPFKLNEKLAIRANSYPGAVLCLHMFLYCLMNLKFARIVTWVAILTYHRARVLYLQNKNDGH
jgi:hypothetical protein